jgi:hypothetical protein
LVDFEVGNSYIKVMACNHIFHEDCLKAWLNKERSCPVCKTNLSWVFLAKIDRYEISAKGYSLCEVVEEGEVIGIDLAQVDQNLVIGSGVKNETDRSIDYFKEFEVGDETLVSKMGNWK